MQVLKIGVPNMGFKPFASWGETWGFESTWVTVPGVRFIARWCLGLSHLLACGLFVQLCRNHSATIGFFSFSEEIVPYVAVGSGSR